MNASNSCTFIRLGLLCVALSFVAILVLCGHARAGDAIHQEPAETSAEIPLAGIVAVSGGASHTCALTNAGAVKCWGDNYWGQLGDGTRTASVTPVDVTGLQSGVLAVAAGMDHTCAMTIAGGVKCWGSNRSGEVGDGSSEILRTMPVDVNDLSGGVQAIAAGALHTCALTNKGGVKCWGGNTSGQLGNGTTSIENRTPVDVDGLQSDVVAVAAGAQHTCALTGGGQAKCWGNNYYGQLGDGTRTLRSAPVVVDGLTPGVEAIAPGGSHTCALTAAGVMCWGHNISGQLGDGTTTDRLAPVSVAGLSAGVQAIATGARSAPPEESHSCALTDSGEVKCWGNNRYGQLGDGTRTDRSRPIDVTGLSYGVQDVSAGHAHTCALTTAGGVKCWGDNVYGELGDGTTSVQSTPANVAGLKGGVQAISTGTSHTCAVTDGGAVKCWGNNADDGWDGQLGDGTITDRSTPIDVTGLQSGVKTVAAGNGHTCALTQGGGVECWGANPWGEVGDGTTAVRLTPTDAADLSAGVKAIATGGNHTCALTDSGGIKCWGDNGDGQLGDGGGGVSCGLPFWFESVCRLTAVDVAGLQSGVQAIAAGGSHTCALTGAGGVKCWGDNVYSQLGDGTTAANRSTPVNVAGLQSGVKAIAAGSLHTCALTGAGGVKCWGYNALGGLGDGTTTTRSAPVDVVGLTSGVQAIAAGLSHTCALTGAGGVKCWGDNEWGQLGDGSTAQMRMTPSDVAGLQSGVQAIAAGGGHTCALTGSGVVKCWGNNYWGQLGTRTLWTPVDVLMPGGVPSLVTLRGQSIFYPGSVEQYLVRVHNSTPAPIQDAVLRVLLPASAEYVDSTAGGVHWWAQREVFWRLGNLALGQEAAVSLRTLYDWGMWDGIDDSLVAQLSGSNLTDAPFDVAPYLAFTPLHETAATTLSANDVNALRNANPELDTLLREATGRGYKLAYAPRHTFAAEPELTRIVLLRFQPKYGAVMLWLQNGRAARIETDGAELTLDTAQAAMQYDPWSQTWSASDAQLSVSSVDIGWWGCFKNCVWEKLPSLAFSKLSKVVDAAGNAVACAKAARGDWDAALDCGKLVDRIAPAVGVAVDLGVELGRCNGDCHLCHGDCNEAACHCCTKSREYCEVDDWLFGWFKVHTFNRSVCNRSTGRYSTLSETYYTCPGREPCVMGPGGPRCVPCKTWPFSATVALTDGSEDTVNLCQTCRTAKDPNALYGPEGDLIPGQRVTYTIAYENIGAGAAHDVFVVDELSEQFDLSTLKMETKTAYSLVGRAVFWDIGDLAPKSQPGSQGAITFSVRLKSGLPSGSARQQPGRRPLPERAGRDAHQLGHQPRPAAGGRAADHPGAVRGAGGGDAQGG